MDDVTWLPIPRVPFYEVSSDGRVRSKDRWASYSDGRRRWYAASELKTWLVRGYPGLSLKGEDGKKNFYLHQIVCEAFHGPRPSPDQEVRHLNGIRTDNRAENLTWGTKKENAQDTIRHGNHNSLNTHCKRGHLFDEKNTLRHNANGRCCRACKNERHRAYYHANRVKNLREQRKRLEARAAKEGRTLRRSPRGSVHLTAAEAS